MTDGVVQIEKKLGFFPLIALVVGTMVGGGVFSLPHDLAVGANSGATIIGWCITAMGMIPLVLVYQTLAKQKPSLRAEFIVMHELDSVNILVLTVLGDTG